MTDIIVTIPKKEYEHVMGDKFGVTDIIEDFCHQPGSYLPFWNLSRKPARATKDDRIWFIFRNHILAYADITRIEEGDQKCDITERDWKGCQIYFEHPEVIDHLDRIKMKGFQGFRYTDRIEGLEKKLKKILEGDE